MAVELKTELIPAIATLRPVPMEIGGLFFGGTRQFFNGVKVEFDVATVNGQSAGYNSFSSQAKVVKKDGFDTITLDPLNINEATDITAENTKQKSFGFDKYGNSAGGTDTAQLTSELEGFNLLRNRGLRAVKKAMYEAITTGKIVYGQNGIVDIDFNMPAGNKEVLTGTSLWSNVDSDPVAKLTSVYDSMLVTPEACVMSETAYNAFKAHAEVLTVDNITTGTKRNFIASENITVDAGTKLVKVGRLADRPLDVYMELDSYLVGTTKTPYMTPNFVVFGSSSVGGQLFGGVPTLGNGGISWEATEFLPLVITEENPVSVTRVYKSAPLPVLLNTNGFYSLKVL